SRPTPTPTPAPTPPSVALVTFGARFPGASGNLNLVFQPRRSPRLLQPANPAPTDTVLLRLTNVQQSALVNPANSLAAASFPLQSLTCAATFQPPSGQATTGQYNFITGQPVIYVDQSGVTHTALPTSAAFATGVSASAVTAGAASTPTLRAPAGIGQTPMYSIPVGPTMRLLFSSLAASPTTLYGTISGTTVSLPRAINPDFAADQSVPLAMFAMSSRAGDGNIYHDSYDISVRSGSQEIYSFADVDLEQDAARSLAQIMPRTPSTGSAVAMQPV